ncbi:MAG: hypothetical protein J1F27_05895 [Prevotellaceae bacterium]|nr:hypothetical protein [Prevotellaceae bacterium]
MQYELFCDADFRQESPFIQRSVCLLGTFRTSSRTLYKKLQELGADVKQGLSRSLHYAVLGKNVPADAQEHLQQLAYHGYRPRVLSEDDLEDIFAGHYSPYVVSAQIVKDLRLTLQHYLDGRFCYGDSMNPLYVKELYLAPDVSGDLYQMLGNRGVYANTYIDNTTDVLVISDNSFRHLQEGKTDEYLAYIERQYNQIRSQTFRFTMTTEGELLAWLNR